MISLHRSTATRVVLTILALLLCSFASTPTFPPSVLKVQVLLDRQGFSPGEIDGRDGPNTRKAIAAFQRARHLQVTERIDPSTWHKLSAQGPEEVLISYTLSPADVAGPFVQAVPKDLMEQSKLRALTYTSPGEALGEKFHCSPSLLERLNPGVKLKVGETIRVPHVLHDRIAAGSALGKATITVSRKTSALAVGRANGPIVFHAPVTTGSQHDPLPLGRWKVMGVQKSPVFYYNPMLFWDANPAHSKAKIAPGPNNPVGLLWIDISKEHYGIHGTPEPSRIGHSESHGCVRLTNWDAVTVASLVKTGTPVIFQ